MTTLVVVPWVLCGVLWTLCGVLALYAFMADWKDGDPDGLNEFPGWLGLLLALEGPFGLVTVALATTLNGRTGEWCRPFHNGVRWWRK